MNFEVTPRARKGKVLTHADFGCLKGIPTLNVTNGCLFQCAYCYARGYSQAPPKGEVQLYVNLPQLLKEELVRKRILPAVVILNTSSDCFQSHPDILRVTYEVMELLLDRAVGISFLTKGEIPARFLDLFRRFPERVLVQVGLVSLSERYAGDYEPYAAPPVRRVRNILNMNEIGISPEVRIDPIIPFLTDTEFEITGLFRELKGAGVKKVTLSYLHLRPAIYEQLVEELSPLHRKLIEACFRNQSWTSVGSTTRTKLLPKIIREKGYQRIRPLAAEFGLNALICSCKNPDLPGDLCSSGRMRKALKERNTAQLPLFRC